MMRSMLGPAGTELRVEHARAAAGPLHGVRGPVPEGAEVRAPRAEDLPSAVCGSRVLCSEFWGHFVNSLLAEIRIL